MKRLVWVIACLAMVEIACAELVVTRTPVYQGGAIKDVQLPPPPPIIADPMREIGGKVFKVDDSWVTFSGTVEQVHPGAGVRIRGYYTGQENPGSDFFVIHFPYQVAEGDQIGGGGFAYKALDAGTYTYSTAANSTRTIHQLDYGSVWTAPPPTPAQIAAQRKKDEANKKKGEDNALKYNQKLAAQGDAYGLLRMGERYRDGDGVETNLTLAKIYLQRAINAGSIDASNELKALKKPKQ